MINMCEGLRQLGNSNNMLLTYGGECFQKRNRGIMCREGRKSSCSAAIEEYIRAMYPSGKIPQSAKDAITAAGNLQCDEFPFANSIEGGDLVNGRAVCVPADDQAWQGGTMGKYFKPGSKNYVAPGDKYKIEIHGWDCASQKPLRKRDDVAGSRVFARDAFDTADGITRTGGK